MPVKLSGFASPEIERLLKRLEDDENCYDAELRSLDREKMVLPVAVSTLDKEFQIHSFSRNISPGGVCLISPQPFSPGMEMNLELNLHNLLSKHAAECRWSQKFGEEYWTSGWQLKSDELDVANIKSVESLIEWDNRSTERKKFAIPVIVHQKGKRPRVHAFTRNLSGGGANLVTSHEISENAFCKLEFVRSDGERCDIIAECVWSKQYGKTHWSTGWQFPRLSRIAEFHAASFEE